MMTNVTRIPYSIERKARELIPKSKILVIGAGGKGCEVLKNLALSGFQDIEIIDSGIVDANSSLGHEFMFRDQNIGKPKVDLAQKRILSHTPDVNITTHQKDVISTEFPPAFFKKFCVVLNTLDNRKARSHINRMCLKSYVPLIDSSIFGHTGQIDLSTFEITQCYECQLKPEQESFPGNEIRNTPSKPEHCVFWAKQLFTQLFGEYDSEKDVSPDTEDPEAEFDGDESPEEPDEEGSIRLWAIKIFFDPEKLFNKLFHKDILLLLKMENLWKNRRPPKPISWNQAVSNSAGDSEEEDSSKLPSEMQVWSVPKCAKVFSESIPLLDDRDCLLEWNKDDKVIVDFVTACANIRCRIFDIPPKSRFEIKSIAGNIVLATPATNAIMGGLMVLYAFRVLTEDYEKCPPIYLRRKSIHSQFVLAPDKEIIEPNPSCYVCGPDPVVTALVNVNEMTLLEFENEILKEQLEFVYPEAFLDGVPGLILAPEEREDEENETVLINLGIEDGTVVKCFDVLQCYDLTIIIRNYEAVGKDEPRFKVFKNKQQLETQKKKNVEPNVAEDEATSDEDDLVIIEDSDNGASPSKK